MSRPVAVLDSCVLYRAPLRDLLLQLMLDGVFRGHWSAQIHEEWVENLLSNRPDLQRTRIERTRLLMDMHAPGALIRDFEPLIDELKLPDPDDRHVVAAAIKAKAPYIVTFNLEDFPEGSLRPWDMSAVNPDRFVSALLLDKPEEVIKSVREVRRRLKNPPQSVRLHLKTLEDQGLETFAESLRALKTI